MIPGSPAPMPTLRLHPLLLLALLLPLPHWARAFPAERKSPLPPLPPNLQQEKEFLLDYAELALKEMLAEEPRSQGELQQEGKKMMELLRQRPEATSLLHRLIALRMACGEERKLLQELQELNQRENPSLPLQCALWDLLHEQDCPEVFPLLRKMEAHSPHDPEVLLRSILLHHEKGFPKERDAAIQMAQSLPEAKSHLPLQGLLLKIAAEQKDEPAALQAAQNIAENPLYPHSAFSLFEELWDPLWQARMPRPLALLAAPVVPLLVEIHAEENQAPDPEDAVCQFVFYVFLKARDYSAANQLLQLHRDTMDTAQWTPLNKTFLETLRDVEAEDFLRKRLMPPREFVKINIALLEFQIAATPLPKRNDNMLRALAERAASLEDYQRCANALQQLQAPALKDDLFLLQALVTLEKPREALALMRQIQRRHFPRLNAEFFLQMAILEAETGQLPEAIQNALLALKRAPRNPDAANFLGYLYACHNFRLDQAEELLRQALEQEPDSPAYLDSLAWLRHRQHRDLEALLLMQKSLQALNAPTRHAPPQEMRQEIQDHFWEILESLLPIPPRPAPLPPPPFLPLP